MIIYRRGEKDKWYYTDKSGKKITDVEILSYIKSLVIPPAYKDVEIYYIKSPKMLYMGFDDKGRKQQIYSKKWREKADMNKFKLLIDFGKNLPRMNLQIMENIKSRGVTKNKLISIILRITTLCGFRIGQLKYQKLYNSTGLSTLKKKHLRFVKNVLHINFIGKKGVVNDCIIEESNLINEIKKISSSLNNNDFLFTYIDTNNEKKLITAIDVNNWLKEYNPDFTTKLFRTFDVNEKLIEQLKNTKPASLKQKERKKIIINLIKDISCSINNTPTICKKSYINSNLVSLYIDHPKKYTELLIKNDNSSRLNFIRFLENLYN